MKGILADNNIEKQVEALFVILQSESWQDLWKEIDLPLLKIRDLGLALDVSDAILWHACQKEELILVTANRNKQGPDSLEATIQEHNNDDSLPVLTIGNAQKVLHSRDYAESVAAQMLDYLMNIEKVRGTGRLYLP